MAIINQHPEWEIIYSWFARRAKDSGVSVYQHTETIATEPSFDQETLNVANELARRAGESIKYE